MSSLFVLQSVIYTLQELSAFSNVSSFWVTNYWVTELEFCYRLVCAGLAHLFI